MRNSLYQRILKIIRVSRLLVNTSEMRNVRPLLLLLALLCIKCVLKHAVLEPWSQI